MFYNQYFNCSKLYRNYKTNVCHCQQYTKYFLPNVSFSICNHFNQAHPTELQCNGFPFDSTFYVLAICSRLVCLQGKLPIGRLMDYSKIVPAHPLLWHFDGLISAGSAWWSWLFGLLSQQKQYFHSSIKHLFMFKINPFLFVILYLTLFHRHVGAI